MIATKNGDETTENCPCAICFIPGTIKKFKQNNSIGREVIIVPFGFIYRCNNCQLSIRVSGLWEFSRTKSGARLKYGHPFAVSKRAARAGVKGLYFEGYCPTCRSVHNAVIVEFSEPQPGSLGACLAYENPDIKHQEFDGTCDTCCTKLIDNLKMNFAPNATLDTFRRKLGLCLEYRGEVVKAICSRYLQKFIKTKIVCMATCRMTAAINYNAKF